MNGSSILAVLLQLAPRSLWPGKPYPFGYTLGLMEGLPPGKSGAPGGTYAGEMFANFGMPGVVVGSLLLGVWCQRIDLLGSTTKDPLKLLLYYLAVWYTAIVMRGDLASSLLPLATLSATVLACRLQRIRRRRSSAYVAAEPSRCGARTASRCLQITPGMG